MGMERGFCLGMIHLGLRLLKERSGAAILRAELVELHWVWKARALMPMHTCAESSNQYVGLHWTITSDYKLAKAADMYSTCCEGRKSYTELFGDWNSEKEGGKLGLLFFLFMCTYMFYIQ